MARHRKIVVVGSRSVGKSSLTLQFVEKQFTESYYPTIESSYNQTIKYKGQEYATEIVDTAGQDEYSIMSSKHFIGIHGYILVYSITSRQSFETVEIIADKILNALAAERAPMVIVGNKSDLKPELRQVSTADGQALAKKLQCSFTEASARSNTNVAKSFELVIAETEKNNSGDAEPESSGNKCMVM